MEIQALRGPGNSSVAPRMIGTSASASGDPAQPLELRKWLEQAEAWYIARTLRALKGNRSGAARALGIGRRTLYAKMQKLGIEASWSPEARR
jgi:DNA-binding NtrC family response regulator